MTPGARVQAAIEVLDRVASGEAAEKALLSWARNARYAGSKDRAAVRDHVFDCLRRWRSVAAVGGGETGRARMVGLVRQQRIAPETLFTGEGHAPAVLTDAERMAGRQPTENEALDLPDWIQPLWADSLADRGARVAEVLRHRADVFLRVNLLKQTRDRAQASLRTEGIETAPVAGNETALRVTENARRVQQSEAFRSGWVELQDAASQAVVAHLPLGPGQRVLDYCAGGGGKALAMAALTGGRIDAHDSAMGRMSDLPERAKRAGAQIERIAKPSGLYDLVLADVPCSGSGAWRRAPEGKWRMSPERLDRLVETQRAIVDACLRHVAPGGTFAYATCSVLACENANQVNWISSRFPELAPATVAQFEPGCDGDGLFVACFTRENL
ncbi:RsmB/NOP family class I SAM-dependent RNA methyltransferase [Cognatishimia sp. F0-27]|uniref:RsmB/NOP family class I SAM-dependent RNA methyltransferase n=1 Tax=Cognatishimia sp. F0-27 TaxID=2816855 RepID=UPI001D0C4EB8|nr:RsmB/NOP family class I SAM-dependent RNA methyltransferase [Cognatishimia sp. F0-27]MCC1491821.1 RsmB/NOP family class I SAM-dependent RNA methyltransferase [Cognatishimia sp. F0-27]